MQEEKIKLCYIISSLANEGPVNVMYNIIKYIDFDVFSVSIVTLVPEKSTSRLKDFKKLNVSIIQLCQDKKVNPISLFFLLKREMEKNGPDVLHLHCPRSLMLASFLPKRIRKIYTAHIYPDAQQKALYGKFKGALIIRLCNFFMLRTDMQIACSKSVSQEFLENKGWIIKSIENGCSLPAWDGDPEHKQALRKKLNLRQGVKYFIFIGRLSKEKKPDFLVKVFSKIGSKSLGIILLGDGVLYDNLKENESDLILIAGFKTNVREYLIAADYYISASETEGLANTLLESMSVGLPMVLSDMPSHQSVLKSANNEIGILFNEKEEKELIRAINKIVTYPYEDTSKLIRALYRNNYTAERMSMEYQKEYCL